MEQVTALRPELPEATARIAALPVDERGYPVPWFVGWVDDAGEEVARGQGTPDHRLIRGGGVATALRREVCWVCGQPLGAYKTFPIGPMCVVNRVTAEPPSHRDCADWSARACPFLTRPHARWREAGLPGDAEEPAGNMIRRNPGMTALWTTKRFMLFPATGGILIRVGEPTSIEWMREGRAATRAEILESVESGLPALREAAEKDGQIALKQLERWTEIALALVPA